ncbi:hypothetical protein V1508DRAFT_232156 [Lipomyces doorenjongii]|uniref:uncharacterized protein n=1 Tax=Lipomyces doorenjongii TaxID=383834 RepID=UPI0034CFA68D
MASPMSEANPTVPLASEDPASRIGRQFQECIVDVPEHGLSEQSSPSSFNPDDETKNYDIERVQPSRKLGFCSKYFEQTRWNALKTFGISILVMGTLLIGIHSIFWGSLFQREKYLNRVNFFLVNFDSNADSIIGSTFLSSASRYAMAAGSATVQDETSIYASGNIDAVYKDVVEEKNWGAFVVLPNATAKLIAALKEPSVAAEYHSNLVQFVYAQAREPSVYDSLMPWISGLSSSFTSELSNELLRLTMNNSDYSASKIVNQAPYLLSTPATVLLTNIRPMDNPVTGAIMQLGLVHLIILSFFQFDFFQQVHKSFFPYLKRRHFLIYRTLLSFAAYFFLSLFFSLLSLAFQVDFTRAYGRGGFVVFWMIMFLGMTAVGGASENIALICVATYPPLVGFWLIFMVISNSSPAFYSIELEASFFKYGYAFPIHNVADAFKTVLFNTKSNIGLNVGVLLAWIAVNTAFAPFSIWIFERANNWKESKKIEVERS